ncbi:MULTISPECIES: MFS transporter [unclassified Adlercreutzia]|uniref:MFS transporter n=1 Tax=unclassified Adlercreutzia TaxID=2636013 RepID=UPI0013ED0E14|nr:MULTISPECIES: MFS transporter [unclassified Adlercreutzia]
MPNASGAAQAKPEYTIADRMNRIPTSPHTVVIIFFVLMGWFAETIDLGGTSFLMPTIREYFEMDATTGGYYSSICFLGMFIGAIGAGRIADRIGRKKTIVGAMLLWGIAGFALVFSPNIYYLFTMRFILGVGLGGQFPVALSYLSEIVSGAERPKYMTLYQLMTPIGFAVAGVLTVLILPHFDWRGVYLAEALPALFIIGIIKTCPESPLWLEAKGRYDEADAICTKFEQEAIARHKELPEPVRIERTDKKASFKDLFSPKYLRVTVLCFFVWFISMFSDYGLTTWLTTILMEKGFDVVQSTGFVTIGILGGIPAWFFATWSAKKLGRKKTFLIAGLCTSIFGIAYGASTTLVMLIITGILYQFGKYLNAMMMALYTPELYETNIRTTGNGLATSWGRMGSILGPIILAGVMTSFGVYTTMYIAAAMVIIPGLLVFLFGPETKDKTF